MSFLQRVLELEFFCSCALHSWCSFVGVECAWHHPCTWINMERWVLENLCTTGLLFFFNSGVRGFARRILCSSGGISFGFSHFLWESLCRISLAEFLLLLGCVWRAARRFGLIWWASMFFLLLIPTPLSTPFFKFRWTQLLIIASGRKTHFWGVVNCWTWATFAWMRWVMFAVIIPYIDALCMSAKSCAWIFGSIKSQIGGDVSRRFCAFCFLMLGGMHRWGACGWQQGLTTTHTSCIIRKFLPGLYESCQFISWDIILFFTSQKEHCCWRKYRRHIYT